MRALACLSAVLIAALFASTLALAQPVPAPPAATPSADDAKEAKRHFVVGNDLYRDGRYADALVEFDASYRLGGRPSALRNGADCRRQLNEYAAAFDAYQALLARHGSQLTAAEKIAVQQALGELDNLTGELTVTSSEDGAEVTVDGRSAGRTPLSTKLRLSVGRHKLLVVKEGFVPFEPPDDVVLISKQVVIVDAKLVLEVVTGHLLVREENGRSVKVFIDNVDRGPAPWEGDLPPGDHAVAARGEKLAAAERSVTIGKGQRVDLLIQAISTVGRLRVTTVPAGAEIYVDGQRVGSGAWEGDVEAGSHHVQAKLGLSGAERDVVVERGSVAAQEIPLPAVEAPPEYKGVYARIAAALFPPSGDTPHVHSVPGLSVSPGTRWGLGLTLHVGYSFGFISAEFVGATTFAGYSDHLDLQGGGGCDVQFNSFNGFIGPGARITMPTQILRVTGALAFGTAMRHFTVDRCSVNSMNNGMPGSMSNTDPGFQSNAGYADPALFFDAGLLFGSTPGTKFFLGAVGWVDFPSQDIAVGPDKTLPAPNEFFSGPGRGYTLASGPQVFFGPTVGVQFGH